MKVSNIGMLAGALWLLAGCGDGALGRSDVEGIPPGTGAGTALSGDYDLELFTRDCVGDCSIAGVFPISLCDVGELDEAEVTVTQNDGVLVMDAEGLVVDRLSGGVDADGSFVVGAYGTQNGGTVNVFVRSTGTVIGERFSGEAESRGAGTANGTSIDCTAVYEISGLRR